MMKVCPHPTTDDFGVQRSTVPASHGRVRAEAAAVRTSCRRSRDPEQRRAPAGGRRTGREGLQRRSGTSATARSPGATRFRPRFSGGHRSVASRGRSSARGGAPGCLFQLRAVSTPRMTRDERASSSTVRTPSATNSCCRSRAFRRRRSRARVKKTLRAGRGAGSGKSHSGVELGAGSANCPEYVLPSSE